MPRLLDQRLIIVSGKGGVGKSSVSAAIALGLATAGRRTLVCEVNAEERISSLLGHPRAGAEVAQLEENLWGVDVRPEEAMREYALMVLKFKSVYRAVFENRVVRYFLRFVPSLQELVMLGKILYHLDEKLPDGGWRFETIVMDAPATGHALTFLSVPQVLLDTVPKGPLYDDARRMRDKLVDPKITSAVLVSLPEEMPVNETLDLAAGLQKRVHIRPHAAVLNGVTGARFSSDDLAAAQRWDALAPLIAGHRARSELSIASHAKLENGLRRPVFDVPRLFVRAFDRSAIERISKSLAPLLESST